MKTDAAWDVLAPNGLTWELRETDEGDFSLWYLVTGGEGPRVDVVSSETTALTTARNFLERRIPPFVFGTCIACYVREELARRMVAAEAERVDATSDTAAAALSTAIDSDGKTLWDADGMDDAKRAFQRRADEQRTNALIAAELRRMADVARRLPGTQGHNMSDPDKPARADEVVVLLRDRADELDPKDPDGKP